MGNRGGVQPIKASNGVSPVAEETAELEEYSTQVRRPTLHWSEAMLSILLSTISLLTVILNLLVIISISNFRQLHTPTNILLLSLAVSDFLVGLLLVPAHILEKTACWILGDFLCSLYYCMVYIITSASIGDMVLISVDRYVAICDPLHYPTRVTERRVKLCVCLCWLCSVFYGSIVFRDDFFHPGRHKSCLGECVIFVSYIAAVFDIIVTLFIPLTVIIVLYMRVFVVAVSQARAMHSHIAASTVQRSVNQANKSELKAAKALGILVLVFLICFCPYYCVTFVGGNMVSGSSVTFVIFVFYFNSCVNPLIYALCYPWFRNVVKLIVTFQMCRKGSCEVNFTD
ncbi:trace amine-associated receptor 1-like [Pholidichthys leucotaenia]